MANRLFIEIQLDLPFTVDDSLYRPASSGIDIALFDFSDNVTSMVPHLHTEI